MDWLLLALLANLFFAFNNVNIQGITKNWVKSGRNYFILFGIIWFAFLSAMLLIFGIPVPSPFLLSLLVVNGILTGLSLYFLFISVSKDDVYKVAVILSLNPAITAVLSFLFLGESFPTQKLVGVLLLITAGVIASLSKNSLGKWKFSPALIYAVLSVVFMSVSNIIIKFATYSLPPTSVLVWGRLFMVLVVLAILIKADWRNDFLHVWKSLSTSRFSMVVGNELVSLVGTLAIIYAFALSTATIITSLSATYPLFVLVLELIYTRVIPGFIESKLDIGSLVLKMISLVLLVPGILLIY